MPKKKQLPLTHLRCLLLRESVTRPRDALRNADELKRFTVKGDLGYQAELWCRVDRTQTPKWREFLQPAISEQLPPFRTVSQAAVLFIKTGNRFVVFTFGQGRYLIDVDRCEPGFGLRTALNLSDPNTLTSIDHHTFEERTKHTRTQSSQRGSIEVFGIDVSRDILRAVAGKSKALDVCRDIAGSEATLAITLRIDMQRLHDTAAALLSASQGTSYREQYAWVDNLARVTARSLKDTLDDELVRLLGSPKAGQIHLAIPEPLDYTEIEYFAYGQQGTPQSELTIEGFLASRRRQNPVNLALLRKHWVWLKRADREQPHPEAAIYKCIVAEIQHHGKLYVLTNGDWFSVNQDFHAEVRKFVESIPESAVILPSWNGSDPEGAFNAAAAQSDASFVCMDRKCVRIASRSTPIEVCDLLTAQKQLIHVKRRDKSSSGLSHLFAQGRNSGELIAQEPVFRQVAAQTIGELKAGFAGQIAIDGFKAQDYEIVFALMGAEPGRVSERLPFFSQLTLMNATKSLRTLGYIVSLKGIPVSSVSTQSGVPAGHPTAQRKAKRSDAA